MIQTVQAPESQETVVSLEQLAQILETHFGNEFCLDKQNGGQDWWSLVTSRNVSPPFQGSVALGLVHVLKELAGKCLAAANAIDVAGGYGPELEFFACESAFREIGVTGMDDDVTFHVANVSSEDDAIARVQQSLALLGLGKQPPRQQRQNSRTVLPEGSGVNLVKSHHSEHRFWLGSDEFTNVDICVWNESDEGKALTLAERFVEFLQAQKPRRRRLTA